MQRWEIFTLLSLLCAQKAEVSKTCEITKTNPFRNDFHIAALILARGGSKGIQLKNLAKVGEMSLLGKSLSEILKVGFQSVWISTDHWDIAKEALDISNQVNIHWRSPESASDSASSAFAVWEFLQSKLHIDAIALVQCTSPFIRTTYLLQGLALFMQSDTDCVFSATKSHKLRWQRGSNGYMTPLNFNPAKRPRRQEWNGEYIENGMFYIANRKLLRADVFQNTRCKIVEIPEEDSLEIDTMYHLKLAQFMDSYNAR